MRGGIRHKVAIALGCVLLALALAACGGTPDSTLAPTPDTEATVQARLNEERAIEATVEAKAQAMAKAMVEATVQAGPRYGRPAAGRLRGLLRDPGVGADS